MYIPISTTSESRVKQCIFELLNDFIHKNAMTLVPNLHGVRRNPHLNFETKLLKSVANSAKYPILKLNIKNFTSQILAIFE